MKLSFQTTILIVFGCFILLGVAVFAGYINIGSGSKENTPSGRVMMWGTVKKAVMDQFINTAGAGGETVQITYLEKNPSTYEQDLVNAFASGRGPDIFMVTPEIFWTQRDKMAEIPYASYPSLSYTNVYMDISRTYMTPTGILALPLYIDPLVGYWNKDIFSSAGMSSAPREWREFPSLADRISIVANDYTITRSLVAMGEYDNIAHAKDIVTLLIMQAGDPIIQVGPDGKLVLSLGQNKNGGTQTIPAAVALDFYSQFADPSKDSYSWNKSFSSDTERFLSSDLAYYFGYGSELAALRRANPNLNFDMAFVPQANTNGIISTSGRLYGLAVSKQSPNKIIAQFAINDMLGAEKNGAFLTTLQKAGSIVAPARRDLKPNDPSNPYASILYQSALVARAWVDPSPDFTDGIVRDMITDVQSGKSNSNGAINTAWKKLNAFVKVQ